jgi:hypothetical protein
VATELFHADERTDITKLTLVFRIFANAPEKVRTDVQAAEIWTQLDQEEIQQQAFVYTIRYFRVRGRKFIDPLSDCEFAQCTQRTVSTSSVINIYHLSNYKWDTIDILYPEPTLQVVG